MTTNPIDSSHSDDPSKANATRSSPRWIWLAAAVALLIVSTYFAFNAPLRPDPYAQPELVAGRWSDIRDWLRYPREQNAALRLPIVPVDLNDVVATKDGKRVWVAGDDGFLMTSGDGGESWRQCELRFPHNQVYPILNPPLRHVELTPFEPVNAAPPPANAPSTKQSAPPAEPDAPRQKQQFYVPRDSFQPVPERGSASNQSVPSSAQDNDAAAKAKAAKTSSPPPDSTQRIQTPDSTPLQASVTTRASNEDDLEELPIDWEAVQCIDAHLACAFQTDVDGAFVYVVTRDGGRTWLLGSDGPAGLAGALGGAAVTGDLRAPEHPFWSDPSTVAIRAAVLRAVLAAAAMEGRYAVERFELHGSVELPGSDTVVNTRVAANKGLTTGVIEIAPLVSSLAARLGAGGDARAIAVADDVLASGNGRLADWRVSADADELELRAVHFARSGLAIAVGARGTIVRYRMDVAASGGAPTRREILAAPAVDIRAMLDPRAAELQAVFVVDERRAWVAGENGVLLHTDDSGLSWRPASRQEPGWTALEFVDRNFGFGCVRGELMRTDDGGKSWSRVPGIGEQAVVGVALDRSNVDAPVLWVVGEHATVLRSRDRGFSFEHVDVERASALPSDLPDLERVGVAGSFVLIESTDGPLFTRDSGASWTWFEHSDAESEATAGAFLDAAWAQHPATLTGQAPVEQREKVAVLFGSAGTENADRFIDGRSFVSVDRDGTFTRQDRLLPDGDDASRIPITPMSLHAVSFVDTDHGWVGGAGGVLFRTVDGGKTWRDPREYGRGLPPWYWGACAGVVLLMVPAVRRPPPRPKTDSSVADYGIHDKPLTSRDPDRLGFGPIAAGVSGFLRNVHTQPPITIAVTGAWGSGKSSLMNLVSEDLERHGFRAVKFNAWHNQHEEDLLASLLTLIRAQSIPSWWTLLGLRFRARLVALRARQHWKLIAVLALVCTLSAGYFLGDRARRAQAFHDLASIRSQPVDAFVALVHFVTGSDGDAKTGSDADDEAQRAPSAEPATTTAAKSASNPQKVGDERQETRWSLFIALISSLGLLIGALRQVQAFGSRATSVVGWVLTPLRRPKRATSAQRQFTDDFKEVAEALDPKAPLILIDDLDRCQPDKIMRMLEAINYVISAGDCFIVLAIDRKRIEDAIRLHYKDTLASEAASSNGVQADDDRRPLETRYLEKLVNIEIQVPLGTPEQLASICTPLDADELEALARREAQNRRARVTRRVAAVIGTLGLLSGVYMLGGRLGRASSTQTPPAPVVSRDPATPPREPNDPTRVAPPRTPRERNIDHDAPRKLVMPEAHEPHGTLWWVALGGVTALVAIGAWRLRVAARDVEHDSMSFAKALKIWQPLAVAQNSTPRAMKRFVNRVRYLAMVQKADVEQPAISKPTTSGLGSLVRKWADWLAVFWRGPAPRLSSRAAQAPAKRRLDEEKLVALGAIEEIDPDLALRTRVDPFVPRSRQTSPAERSLLDRAMALHAKEFESPLDDADRERFLEMAARVRTM